MLTRITPPTLEPVTLAEAKAHLSVIGTADDALLQRLVSSAITALDGPEGKLGRALIAQTWRLDLPNGFPAGGFIRLPMPPVISVESVKYLDFNGLEQTLSEITVSGLGSADHATIAPVNQWPSAKTASIEFVAGFGQDADAVPEDIRNAILASVGSLYAWRESTVMLANRPYENPEVDGAVERWRARGFG